MDENSPYIFRCTFISESVYVLSFFYSSNFRPSLTRAETIESCNSDDLVTVLEMHNRKPYKIIDRKRDVKKGVMAESLDELICRGKYFLFNLHLKYYFNFHVCLSIRLWSLMVRHSSRTKIALLQSFLSLQRCPLPPPRRG